MPDNPSIQAFPSSLRTARDRHQALQHLEALLQPLGVQVVAEAPLLAHGRYLRVYANHPDLSALFWLEHRLDDSGGPAGPLVHWHGASRWLVWVSGAWSSVNAFHGKKATSFPLHLTALPGVLQCGFQAVVDRTAFVPTEGLEVAHG